MSGMVSVISRIQLYLEIDLLVGFINCLWVWGRGGQCNSLMLRMLQIPFFVLYLYGNLHS